jgi:hypothetical protein
VFGCLLFVDAYPSTLRLVTCTGPTRSACQGNDRNVTETLGGWYAAGSFYSPFPPIADDGGVVIDIAPACRRLATAAVLVALAVPPRIGAQGTIPTAPRPALLWNVAPDGQGAAAARDAGAGERSSCKANALIAGGPAAGQLGPARMRLASSLAAAVALPVCGRRPLVLSARGEASTLLAPLQLGAWRTSGAAAIPAGGGSVWLAYRGSIAPVERPSLAPADSGHAAREASMVSRDLLQEVSLGASRRVGQVMLSVAAGGARGVVRDDVVTSRTVIDSVWNDTSGWVPNVHEIGGGRATRSLTTGWLTGEVNASWLRERVALTATIGGWLPSAHVRGLGWGALELARRLQPGVWLVAGAGVSPDASRAGAVPGRYSMVGLRLSYTATGERRESAPPGDGERIFTITPASAGSYTIALRSRGAKRAEISGDFTGWQPMALAPARGGWWVVTVRLAPGAYRMNVRIDGGTWRAPPGTTPIADDFGGSAGLVVVPDR